MHKQQDGSIGGRWRDEL